MRSSGPAQKRRRLTGTQVVVVVVLAVGNCLIFSVLGWVLFRATSTPGSPAVAGEPGGAEATVTLVALTPSPTRVPLPALEPGWTMRGQPGDGFTIALPDNYVELDLNAETMDAALDPVRAQNPNMPANFMAGWTTEGYRGKGLKLAAIEVAASDAPDFAVVDISCDTLDAPLALDAAVRELIHRYPDLGWGILSNERVRLPVGEAEVFQLTGGPDDRSSTTQYLLIKDGASCFVTFTCDADTAGAHAPTFAKIVETFRWSEEEER